MKILICDDEIKYVEMLESHVSEYMKSRLIDFDIITSTEPDKILSMNLRYDLAFLDIQMVGVDGITLAKQLRNENEKIVLFFVTNFDEYQDDAMDLHAFRYFSKPFDTRRLYTGLDKAMEYIDGAYVDFYLCGQEDQQKILVDDILYITRINRKVIVNTKSGSYPVRENYDVLCNRMPNLFFYPVHKSFYVNLHYIQRYIYSEIVLSDGTRIPVASRKQALFHKYWFEYLRRR